MVINTKQTTFQSGELIVSGELNDEFGNIILDFNDLHSTTVKKVLFDKANTILKANTIGTPTALEVAAQRLVGRITSGVIAALTAAQVKTMLNINLSDINIDCTLDMGMHSIELGAGQTVDGRDVSGIEEGATKYHHSGSVVYNTNSPNTWTDLDLSGIVGNNYCLVLLRIKPVSPSNYGFRRKGDTEEAGYNGSPLNTAMLSWASIYTDCICYTIMETDSNGILEWKGNETISTHITLVGYWK